MLGFLLRPLLMEIDGSRELLHGTETKTRVLPGSRSNQDIVKLTALYYCNKGTTTTMV